MSLLLIETKTKKYAEEYNTLSDTISAMEAEIERVRDTYMPGIKESIRKLKTAGEDLQQSITDNKELFQKPKTHIFHNFRVGFIKGKGKKEFNNDTTIKLIRKHYPQDVADTLIQVKETVISKAIEQLPTSELKKIGVNIINAQDEVTIKPVDSEIQKIVNKIITELTTAKKEEPIIVIGRAK